MNNMTGKHMLLEVLVKQCADYLEGKNKVFLRQIQRLRKGDHQYIDFYQVMGHGAGGISTKDPWLHGRLEFS